MMMLFSTLEGPISHSERKKSACCKVLVFTIWNVFFFNVLSGSVINQLNALSSPKEIPTQLARAVPLQVHWIFCFLLVVKMQNIKYSCSYIQRTDFILGWVSPVAHCSFIKTLFLLSFQATFFTTYVLTSGWASLSSELMQLFGLIWTFVRKYILRKKEDSDLIFSFPYHTELPKVLLFGLLGFTCSVLAPLILPFLLIYFFLAYVVYRNQVRN
jgi:hypothetical protein